MNNLKIIMKSSCYLFIMLICLIVIVTVFGARKISAENKALDILSTFIPSGWMGDGEYGKKYVNLDNSWSQNPHSEPHCVRIKYTTGPHRWAGIYWQNKPDNWGDYIGVNFQPSGYKKLSFWAKGEKGGEIVEFKAGGIRVPNKKYIDSFEASSGRILLDNYWQQYTIDLDEKNLSSIIGGFCWVLSSDYNIEKTVIFYLDDVKYTF